MCITKKSGLCSGSYHSLRRAMRDIHFVVKMRYLSVTFSGKYSYHWVSTHYDCKKLGYPKGQVIWSALW